MIRLRTGLQPSLKLRLDKTTWQGSDGQGRKNAERPTPDAQCRSHSLRSDCGPLRSPEESKKEEVGVKKFTK